MKRTESAQEPERRLYSIAEAAAACGVSVATIQRAIHSDGSGSVPYLRAKKVGARYRILASELERWVHALPEA